MKPAADALWKQRFAELKRHVRIFGHARISNSPIHRKLREWLLRQEGLARAGGLPAGLWLRFQDIGVALLGTEDRWHLRWQERFEQLLEFRRRFGHTRVAAKWRENIPLGHWVSVQREFRKRGMLSAERIQRLEAIGFEWNLKHQPVLTEGDWQQMRGHLAEFIREHGHARVPRGYVPAPGLKQWATRQRRLQREGSLPPERRKMLDAIGFPWGEAPVSSDDRWERRFAQLLEYRARFGHCRVPTHWKEDSAFGHWAYSQRAFRKEGSLSAERTARLEAIGFEWETPRSLAYLYDGQWAAMFSRLLDWQKEHGHTEVPATWKEHGLGNWVLTQREHGRKGTLQPERRRKLEEIGFAWRSTLREFAGRWERRFQQLLAFRERFGHCRVPARWAEDVPLGHWVEVQREFRKKGLLAAGRIARLDAIGFEWHGRSGRSLDDDQRWMEMFASFAARSREYGSADVPQDCMDRRLRVWVNMQRYQHRRGSLLPERREKLESIGFAWQVTRRGNTGRWESGFQRLLAFRKRFGHCRVPAKWSEDVPLGHWVGVQRHFKKKGMLSAERIRRLEEIGFEWSLLSRRAKKTNP